MTQPVGHAQQTSGFPAWAWWLIGGAGIAIGLLVWYAVATAPPAPVATATPTPTPSVSESPTPMPSPTDVPSPEPTETLSPTPEPEPSDSPTPMPSPTDEPEPSDSPTPMPSPTDIPTAAEEFGNGTYMVGTDVVAGVYRTTAEVPGDGARICSWRMLAADGETFAGNALVSGGIPTATLANGDTITTRGCGTWAVVDESSLDGNPTTVTIPAGVWLVGADIPAGTYGAVTGSSRDLLTACAWQQRSGLEDNFATVVARGISPSGEARVVLEVGQQFESSNCGEWTRLDR